MKIMIVDDHALFRDGLVAMLRSQPDLKVVAEAGSVQEAIKEAKKHHPDLILLDLGLPDGSGLTVLHRVLAESPATKICVLTVHEDSNILLNALRMGAKGFLHKNLTISQLVNSIHAIERGEAALSHTMMAYVLEDYTRLGILNGGPQALKSLTPRELEVLELLANGASNREIAERLVIAVNTVKIHVRRILDKLGLQNRGEATSFARRHGVNSLSTQALSASAGDRESLENGPA